MLALSDVLALGVIVAAAGRGIAVPRELSVTGFDIPEAAARDPVLTTVRQPHAGKGAAAVRPLLDATLPETVSLARNGAVVRL